MTARLSQTHTGFLVAGQVTFENVVLLCKEGEAFFKTLKLQSGVCEIDLNDMEEKNAAALALLLAWARAAIKYNLKLRFVHPSSSLQRMAASFGLTDFMEQ